MTELEILEKLKEIFHLIINRDADLTNITKETEIVNDLGVSSIGLIYLMVAIEEMFAIDLSDVTFNTFVTIDDVVQYIENKI